MRTGSKSFFLAICLTLSAIFLAGPVDAASKGKPGGKSSAPKKVVLQKQATIDLVKMSLFDTSGKSTTAILKIARTYNDKHAPLIEPKLRSDFLRLAPGRAAFDGTGQDERKAVELANIAAGATLAADARNFSVTLACVAFTKAVKKNLTAHNLAAALNLSATAKNSKAEPGTIRADAAAVYQYAVSLDTTNVDTLVNLGNVYMDLDRQEDARIMFEGALKQRARYSRARQGMAAYWLARGDRLKAARELEKDKILLPLVKRKISEESKDIGNPQKVPMVTLGDSLEKCERAVHQLAQLKPVSTADFIEEFDPVVAQQIRLRINNLPKSDQLILPKITSIASVSSYQKYFNDTNKFADYEEEMRNFFEKWGEGLGKRKMAALGDMGMEVSEESVTLPPGFDPGTMGRMAASARQAARSGDFSQIRAMLSKLDPAAARVIEPMKSGEDAIGAYTNWYNMQVLTRKKQAYFTYFPKLKEKLQKLVEAEVENTEQKLKSLEIQEAKKIEKLMEQQNATHVDMSPAMKKVNIQYALMRNKERENCFHRNFDMMVRQYISKLKPAMENMWLDMMPHVRLITEQQSRDKWYLEISEMGLSNSATFLGLVLGSAVVDSNWEDVTQEDMEKAVAELDEAARRKAQEDMKAGNAAPEELSEESLLDRFSLSQSWGPIDVTITPTSIKISGAALLAATLSYDWESDVVSGGVGLGVRLAAEGQGVGVKAEAITMLTYEMDMGSGKITELDWKGNAGATTNAGPISAGGNYEASVMHGNKFTDSVDAAYGVANANTYSGEYQ